MSAEDYVLRTAYENCWFDQGPPGGAWTGYFDTNASTTAYGGHVLGNTTNTLPVGGQYGLEWSAFGQPVEGIQSDVALGDFIPAPPDTDTNVPPANFVAVPVGDNPAAYYQCTDPLGGAFWVPSTGRIIAAQPNNISIAWRTTAGGTNLQVVNVNSVPIKRAARIFWTESPYDAPQVNMNGLFPVIHYNTQVPPLTNQVVTTTNGGFVTSTTNVIAGVWLDDQKQLHAKGVSGLFIVEYYEEGSYARQVQPDGIEVVQVMAPDLQLVETSVGARLLPIDTYWADVDGINGILPNVTQGFNDTAYVHAQAGPKDNWVYAIKRTWSEPWALEIYWQHKGRMGVLWPYEVDWYSCDWPRYPQRYVLGDAPPTDSSPVLIPNELTATLMEDMDPPLHASLSSSGRSFSTTQPGLCLLKYTTSDNIWFEVVHTVSHTNELYFDLKPVAWPIGEELNPGEPEAHALRFDGAKDYVMVGQDFLNRRDNWTLAFWFKAAKFTPSVLYSEGQPAVTMTVELTAKGQLQVQTYSQEHKAWSAAVTTNAPVRTNTWHYLAVTYTGGSETNGTLGIHLDEFTWETNHLPWPSASGAGQSLIGAKWVSGTGGYPTAFFPGELDEVRVWNIALTSDQIRSNRYFAWPETADSLAANFPFNEGQGSVLYNLAGDHHGSAYGSPTWCYGQFIPLHAWSDFPGYIHVAEGDRYNLNLYAYPTEAAPNSDSHVFGVNTGQLEVWWANRSRQVGMPLVYYPSRVVRYTNTWPAAPPQMVIASGFGSGGDAVLAGKASPSIYWQNDPALPGYNPNEEHALMVGEVVYALRNDLNTPASSAPFVLVDYLNSESGRPGMRVFQVLTTNATYRFELNLTAGSPILPIMPLGAMPLCAKTYTDTDPPAWRDRKHDWWAISAGDDGGTADAVMRFYYQMQPTFYFPDLPAAEQPAIGQELPWLPTPFSAPGTEGHPTPFVYHIAWPTNAPELKLGQTLTVATHGLPSVWDQLSVDVQYDQSTRVNYRESVLLFDPVVASGVSLPRSPVIEAMIASKLARQDLTSSLIRFPELPPSLYPRIYYDPNRGSEGELVLVGQRVSTLTGAGGDGSYLLLNLLEEFEKEQAMNMAEPLDPVNRQTWRTKVGGLNSELTLIYSNTAYVNAALTARLTNGVGFVTLAFNNSTNRLQVPPGQPVSVKVIKVVPELYSGELEVLLPDDALAEQLSLRYSADLGGQAGEAEFQWRWVEPVGGLVPNTNYGTWSVYGSDAPADTNAVAAGMNEVSLSGASPFTMSDHYFAVRYRPINPYGPTGTNWSGWTKNLAPGWVKRAMTGVNPFEQIFHDRITDAVDTRVTMVSQAGGPYEGDVALNLSAASSAGLIATYQTIFNRAKAFSIEANMSDAGLNQTLLFAATRLHDLYTLLGNEAFADAQDPTVAFPRSLAEDQHGADATALFPFMNQVPNLLEEELGLLRGRDDTLEPSVHTSPTYNRLIWNFTEGLNGGEPTYAYNYNLKGTASNTVGMITAADAKRYYPQGHGDAWGHYLSAITPYYDLLSHELFGWQTTAEATLIGNATVSTDYLDEQKFAETAAARARSGVEIVKQTFRQRYSEDATGRWPGYTDSNTNRAWGVGEWASRAGQAALYDWAVANSLMLDKLTNMVQVGGSDLPPEGIQKIDRASTPELSEITQIVQDIQNQVDSANTGLNPLGLARNVVPFDIDPTAIDAGQTHFEQIYDRALQALYNACVAFDHARSATLQLREQSDSTYDLEESLAANENDYHNRLIQLYGYPYSDDIGPGKTYPQGYDGPDLLNWQILDLENLLVNAPTGQVMQVQVLNLNFTCENDFSSREYKDYLALPSEARASTNNLGTISVHMADNGLRVKPPGWSGQRAAQGELQLALSDFVQTWYSLEAKMADYNQTLAELEVALGHQQADYVRYPNEWEEHEKNSKRQKNTADLVANLKIAKTLAELVAASIKEGGEVVAELLPHVSTYVILFPGTGFTIDTSPAARLVVGATFYASLLAAHGMEAGAEGNQVQQEKWNIELEQLLTDNQYQSLLQWNTADTLVKLKGQYVKQAELFAQTEALSQSYQRVQKLLGDGQRLVFERGQVRARAAQRIQSQRYADISFRIFRNDALRRYQTAFDLAARYTYLAAKAYDYETGLLSSDTAKTPGSKFLEDVVRARLPGRFYVWLGTPMVGGVSGEPGLADILARMKGDWDVVKGRFGFNNPDTETSRFSLRTELFRITTATNADPTWAQALEDCRVANLNELPEFVRYCRPYSSNTNVEPGLVIPFSSFVVAGKNFFGHDLAGGDNAYDATHAATKVRSVGVWFTGYNITFNTNGAGAGLGNEPRVYLIPVGEDVMRSPTRGAVTTRAWTVFDQAIPLPYNVGAADVDNPDWIPVINSLREPLAQIRRYASLRAYHDRGQFDEAETHNNARLVGRSVWNSRWLLIIPGRTLLSNPDEGINRFIYGAANSTGVRDGTGIKDIKIFFQTYSISGD